LDDSLLTSVVHIDLLADIPGAINVLAPPLLEYWRFALPEDTLDIRRQKLRDHCNRDVLPIAWIAHRGDEILGTAALRVSDLPGFDHLTPWLGGVFVHANFRRQGIGSALCHHVEMHAWKLGYSQLHLFTLDQQRLYEDLGWKRHSEIQWAGRPGTLMVKRAVV
jgi:GNAT superfamily N-acetyltransferase